MTQNIRTLLHRTIIMVSLVFMALSVNAAQVKLKLGSNGNPVVGQSFNVIVELNGVSGAYPENYSIPNAKIVYHSSYQSSSYSNINGRSTSSSSQGYRLTVKCYKAGKLTLPPITIGGVRSNSLSIDVKDKRDVSDPYSGASANPAAGNAPSGPRFIGKGNKNLFMVANVSKTTAYEQEALVYTVKLYSSFDNIHFLGASEAPKFNGFTLEENNPKVESLHFESYKGRQYACAVIARYIIFPQMKGKLTIQGNRYTVTAEARQEFWDPFWGPLSYGKPVQLVVTPNNLTVDVRELPKPQPAGFSGGVGQFTIQASMPTQRLATNQAASIVYTIKGTGNIKYVQLPDLAKIFPKEFEISTPSPTVNATPNGTSVSGSVRFDCSIMPAEPGKYHIPPVELVYFNPNTGKYETARSRGFDVEVTKGKAGGNSAGHILKMDEELMPVGKLTSSHTFFSGSVMYWMLYVIAFVIFAAILSAMLNYRKRHADTQGLLERRARRLSDRLLCHARKSLKMGARDKFFDQTLTALWGYAAHKMRMPGSEMQRANIEANFAEHEVPQKVIERFINLLDRCEEAKYAGAGIDMNDVYEEASQVIRAIDSDFKK